MSFFSVSAIGNVSLADFIPDAIKDPMNSLADKISTTFSVIVVFFMMVLIQGSMLFTNNDYSCQFPPEYNGNWQSFAKSFCYVNPFDYLTSDTDHAKATTKLISYFPWLPMILFVQLQLLYVPGCFWHSILRHSDLDLTTIVHHVRDLKMKVGEEADKAWNSITEYIIRQKKLSIVHPCLFCLNSPVVCLYLLKKWLAFFIAVFQFYVIVQLIGQGDYGWGFNALQYSLSGFGKSLYTREEYRNRVPTSSVFPTFVYCNFPFYVDGIQETKTVSCVLTINYLAEKVYIVMYFWLIFASVVALMSALYGTIFYMIPFFHVSTVKDGLKNSKVKKITKERLHDFIYNFLHADGLLALKLVKDGCSVALFEQFLENLWTAHQLRNKRMETMAANGEIALGLDPNATEENLNLVYFDHY